MTKLSKIPGNYSLHIDGKSTDLSDAKPADVQRILGEQFVTEMLSGNFNLGQSLRYYFNMAQAYGYVKGYNAAVDVSET